MINTTTETYSQFIDVGLIYNTTVFHNDGMDSVKFDIQQTGSSFNWSIVLGNGGEYKLRFYSGSYVVNKYYANGVDESGETNWVWFFEDILTLGDLNYESVDVTHEPWTKITDGGSSGADLIRQLAANGLLAGGVIFVAVIVAAVGREKYFKQDN